MASMGYFKTEKNPFPPFVKGWLWLEIDINTPPEAELITKTMMGVGK